MSALDLRKHKQVAYDIHGNKLHVGDIISRTQTQLDHYHYDDDLHKVGDQVRIEEIYTVPDYYGNDLLGSLVFVDGSGSVWNSTLSLWEKVTDG